MRMEVPTGMASCLPAWLGPEVEPARKCGWICGNILSKFVFDIVVSPSMVTENFAGLVFVFS